MLDLKEHRSRRRLELLPPDLQGRKVQALNFSTCMGPRSGADQCGRTVFLPPDRPSGHLPAQTPRERLWDLQAVSGQEGAANESWPAWRMRDELCCNAGPFLIPCGSFMSSKLHGGVVSRRRKPGPPASFAASVARGAETDEGRLASLFIGQVWTPAFHASEAFSEPLTGLTGRDRTPHDPLLLL